MPDHELFIGVRRGFATASEGKATRRKIRLFTACTRQAAWLLALAGTKLPKMVDQYNVTVDIVNLRVENRMAIR